MACNFKEAAGCHMESVGCELKALVFSGELLSMAIQGYLDFGTRVWSEIGMSWSSSTSAQYVAQQCSAGC